MRSGGFRSDVQALRAVAVVAVVLNHLWPTRLTGGYVGVDVFFVISGFLISSHLIREIDETGRIRLVRFYARRVRRLLPAAFVVLAFTVVAAYVLVPYPRWASNAQEVIASASYWENWLLAAKSVDYSQYTAVASLTQHYWSLSVEEQFYLCWPLLLLLFAIPVQRARLVGIVLVGGASLAFSVYFTEVSRSQAYFVTPARVWEFAIGALIAVGGVRFGLPRIAANLASLAGVGLIVAAAVLFDDRTDFPGALALIPVLGAGLVIVAGTHDRRQWHTGVSASRPVRFLGDISYSLYLWHWPLIVLAPFAVPGLLVAGAMTFPLRVGILTVAVALAALSKRLIEDPVRTWPRLGGSVRWTFAGMSAALLVVVVVAAGLWWTYDRHVAQAARDQAAGSGGACRGAAALSPGSTCADPFGPAPNVTMGPANAYYTPPADCPPQLGEYLTGTTKTTTRCDFSGGAAHPPVVWLVGDSHAQQWQGPLLDLARKNHWVFYFSYVGGCPFARVQATGYEGTVIPGGDRRCMDWTASMVNVIAASRPTSVFTSFFARGEPVDDHSGRSQAQQYQDGLAADWSVWTHAGARVFVLGDPPLNADARSGDCVLLNAQDPRLCAVDRAVAQPLDPLAAAARASRDPAVRLIDLTDYFCDRQRCYGVIGKVAVYYDATHLNLEYSLSLEPMIAAAAGLPD